MEKLGLEELLVRDKAELKSKLVELLSDEGRIHRLGERARENVLKHFTWDKAASQMVNVWEKILNSG